MSNRCFLDFKLYEQINLIDILTMWPNFMGTFAVHFNLELFKLNTFKAADSMSCVDYEW